MHPIKREIGTVFVSVSHIETARDWYCGLLGVAELPDILFGHLCIVPMQDGSGLALDSKDFAGPNAAKPAFHLNTDDVHGAHAWLAARGVDVHEVTDGVFFNFKDPDGNLLMVANVPPAPRAEERMDA